MAESERWMQLPSVPCVIDAVHRLDLKRKVFKSGSLGLYGCCKIDLDGTRTQVTVILTVVNSAPGRVAAGQKVDKLPPAPKRTKSRRKARTDDVVQDTLDSFLVSEERNGAIQS